MADWPTIRKAWLQTMSAIDLRFKSGNDVPVERAHLTATEFKVFEDYAMADEDLSMRQADRINELTAELEAARRDAAGITRAYDQLKSAGVTCCKSMRDQLDTFRRDAEIGAVVWRNIDRMNDVCPEHDPAEKIVAEFVAAVMPLILASLDAAPVKGEEG